MACTILYYLFLHWRLILMYIIHTYSWLVCASFYSQSDAVTEVLQLASLLVVTVTVQPECLMTFGNHRFSSFSERLKKKEKENRCFASRSDIHQQTSLIVHGYNLGTQIRKVKKYSVTSTCKCKLHLQNIVYEIAIYLKILRPP